MTQSVPVTASDTVITSDAIQLDENDNVATALRALNPNQNVRLRLGSETIEVNVIETIPLCHKFATAAIAANAKIVKYGHAIGEALEPIAQGQCVHVHNMSSLRGRRQQSDG